MATNKSESKNIAVKREMSWNIKFVDWQTLVNHETKLLLQSGDEDFKKLVRAERLKEQIKKENEAAAARKAADQRAQLKAAGPVRVKVTDLLEFSSSQVVEHNTKEEKRARRERTQKFNGWWKKPKTIQNKEEEVEV